MDWEALLKEIPQLLLLIIPGFIALVIQDEFEPKKKRDDTHIALYSVLYSFIIGTVFKLLVSLSGIFFVHLDEFLNRHEEVVNLSYIVLAIIMGAVLTKFPRSRIIRKFFNWLNPASSPEPSVWTKAMKKEHGAWVTVYLDNGMIYTGQLINYTDDPNEEQEEILLSNFRLAIKCDLENSCNEDFCRVITDYTEKDSAQVYLKNGNIIAIELFQSDEV